MNKILTSQLLRDTLGNCYNISTVNLNCLLFSAQNTININLHLKNYRNSRVQRVICTMKWITWRMRRKVSRLITERRGNLAPLRWTPSQMYIAKVVVFLDQQAHRVHREGQESLESQVYLAILGCQANRQLLPVNL